MKKNTLSKLALCIGITMASVFTANAHILPTFSKVTPSGADFRWDYSTTVTQGEQVVSGNSYFTIYDFGGFVPGSNQQPTGWTFSSSLTGLTPFKNGVPAGFPADNPNIPDLTWKYTGATKQGPFNAGLFSALSTTKFLTGGTVVAQATLTAKPGQADDSVDHILVPVPEMSALMPIIAICGLGLASFATSIFRRRQALI